MIRFAARLLVALIATVVALVVAEGALRLSGTGAPRLVSVLRILGTRLGASATVHDDDLLMRFVPDKTILGYYHINGRGWRGPDVDDDPAAETLRIVCVGDSCTFGFGLKESDTWPAALQHMLDVAFEGVQSFEVINTGVTGYSTWQNLLQIQGDVAELSADLVLVLPSGHNDITGARRFSDREATAFNHGLRRLIEDTNLYRSLDQLAGGSPEQGMEVPPPGVPSMYWRVSPRQLEENLLAMVGSCRDQGSKPVFIASPQRADVQQSVPAYGNVVGIVESVAKTTETPLADPVSLFAARAPELLFVDRVHPNATGARLIAFAALKALVHEEGLLPDSPRRAFLACWMEAREQGLAQPERRGQLLAAMSDGGAPPLAGQAFDWLRARDPGGEAAMQWASAAPDGAADLPEAVRRFDPLGGSEADPYGLGRSRVWGSPAGPERAAEEALRWKNCEVFVVPADPFASLLQCLDLDALPGETLALARTLSIMEGQLGLPSQRFDKRLDPLQRAVDDGQHETALGWADAMLTLEPDDVRTLYLRGCALRRLGRLKEAWSSFERIIEIDPDSPAGHAMVGQQALKAERYSEAEEHLVRAVAVDPAYALARYLLGRLYLAQGRYDEAEIQLGAARVFGEVDTFPDLLDLLGVIATVRDGAGR